MLSKHKNSKLNTGLGVALSTVLCVFALTKAPTLIAADNPQLEQLITMNFKEVRTGKIISLISDFSEINILMPDKLREKVISVHLKDTSVLEALEKIARSNAHEIQIKNNIVYIVPSNSLTPSYNNDDNGNAIIDNTNAINENDL